MGQTISAEQQLTNVIKSLRTWSDAPSQPGRMWNIKAAIVQLDQMWDKYLAGKLQPLDQELPF